MKNLLMRITTVNNPQLSDDTIVDECMTTLMTRYPQIKGYQWERVDGSIHILMWGDIDVDPID